MRNADPVPYSQEDWEDVESPELTEEELAELRPAEEVLPDLVRACRRTRGPQKAPTKEHVNIRLDRDVLEHFRAKGRGWQSKINEALRRVRESERT